MDLYGRTVEFLKKCQSRITPENTTELLGEANEIFEEVVSHQEEAGILPFDVKLYEQFIAFADELMPDPDILIRKKSGKLLLLRIYLVPTN